MADKNIVDMDPVSQNDVDDILIAGSLTVDGLEEARSIDFDAIFTRVISKLEDDYKIKFGTDSSISLWSEDAEDYIKITAVGEIENENLSFDNQ